MSQVRTCQECWAPLASDAPEGFCPTCMLEGALKLGTHNKPPEVGTTNRRFGDYELLEEIARGGMGIVWRARQVSLNRTVAVKMILGGEFASREQALRFRAEAEAAARLQHPNIVRIHETGEVAGQAYFSMDYIEGKSLSELVRDKPFPAKRAAAYVQRIAEATHYAHEHGILHRDLKPSNVLIDEHDQPRITDFGLAKRVERESFMTVTGQVLGSPSFMPPEQADAKRGKAGRYSDVYALGGILFYLVTGRAPFIAGTVAETLHHVLNTEPVSPRLLNPSVPADIATICLKCLEKDPAKRYQTAQQLVDELTRFLNGEPIQARPVGRAEKTWRWCRRHPAVSIAIACAILAAVIASLFGAQARRVQNQLACEQKQNALDKALLMAWSGDLDATEAAIRELELTGASVGSVRMLRGSVAIHRGDYREAVQHLEQAWKLSPQSMAACAMLIQTYIMLGRWDQAQPMLKSLERLTPRTPEDFLFKGSLDAMVDPAKGLESLNEAVRLRPTGIGRLSRASARMMLAQDTGRIEDAEAALADINASRTVLPSNPGLIALSLGTHLIAASIYEEHQSMEKRAAVWHQAELDAAALEQFPTNQAAVFARAMYLKRSSNDWTPLEKLTASPDDGGNSWLNYLRVVALYRRGDWQAALDEVNRSAERIYSGDWMRGYILAELPDGPELARKECYRLCELHPSSWDIGAFQTTLLLLGRREGAIAICRKFRERGPVLPPSQKEWSKRLLDYLCADASEAELLKAVGASRNKLCEAHFFIGLTRLADGDRDGARKHFRASVATRVAIYFDYDWSGAFLARLEKDPNWPPWIPIKPETSK
ncbi:MAG: protein kinase [Verrucomicrobia subdivision 3 bacterium]|nr:protein kinase [Limisphaerales bacterium]